MRRWAWALVAAASLGSVAQGSAGAGSPEIQAVRFETAGQTQTLTMPVVQQNGAAFVAIKIALDYLGGSTEWHPEARKIKVRGPSDREVMLTLGMPKIVVQQQTFSFLPHVPILRQGRILVSLESLELIWRQVGSGTPSYDPQARIFRVSEASEKAAPAALPAAPVAKASAAPMLKGFKPLVVIDAGHGGKDPGAIGPTRLYEKTVTLEVASQLKDQFESLGARVIMTRSDDRFIPLEKRAEIANRARADLFISVHANASRDRKALGSQVFIYNREASSRKAAETARLENLDTNFLEIIKDDLRQSVHEEASITAAGLVSQELGKLGLERRPIERAPFYVLAKAQMPAILVETAFISHPAEEKKLRTRSFCKELAIGIFQGIKNYYMELTARR